MYILCSTVHTSNTFTHNYNGIIKTYVFRSHVKSIFLQFFCSIHFNSMSKRNLKALYKGCVNINRKIIIQLD